MLDLIKLANENKTAILDMGEQYKEYFTLNVELRKEYCPATSLDANHCYNAFKDSEYSVSSAVYQQHRKTDAYIQRMLDLMTPTKEIKCAISTLRDRGYAVSYQDGVLVAVLAASFGAVAVMVECDTWSASQVEYNRELGVWRNKTEFTFCPWYTLTDYRDRRGYPAL